MNRQCMHHILNTFKIVVWTRGGGGGIIEVQKYTLKRSFHQYFASHG